MIKDKKIIHIYERYAPFYDHLFGKVFDSGRKEVVANLQCEGESILEVGIGTGISLPMYPVNTFVHGIDFSPSMLLKAQEKVEKNNLSNVELSVMDAQNMIFEDNCFDKVVAMYVASVVSDTSRLVSEIKRVCKPGGDMYILNHFSSNYRFIHFFEKRFAPFSDFLGWEPVFCLHSFIEMHQLKVVTIKKSGIFGYWPLIHARNI